MLRLPKNCGPSLVFLDEIVQCTLYDIVKKTATFSPELYSTEIRGHKHLNYQFTHS